MAKIWEQYLPAEDREVLSRAGYHQRMGFGQRPAIVVVDVVYSFVGEADQTLERSQERWPNACGPVGWAALPHIRKLLECGRANGIPVFLTTEGFRSDGWDKGSWAWKSGRTNEWIDKVEELPHGSDIHPGIGPCATDIVLSKLKPSAFNATPLHQLLTLLQADSIIVAGTTTSGCVRATVVDAFSENFRVIVAEEGCFDRVKLSHAVSLCDMDAKYADVVSVEEIMPYLAQLPANLFKLPRG